MDTERCNMDTIIKIIIGFLTGLIFTGLLVFWQPQWFYVEKKIIDGEYCLITSSEPLTVQLGIYMGTTTPQYLDTVIVIDGEPFKLLPL